MESEMDAEMRFHLEAYAEDLVRGGMPQAEALRRARVAFGGIEQKKEECREARGVSFVESVIQDLRFGLRMLRKNPGFTITAVATLALGIGANTAIFSLVNAVFLSSLPIRDPGSLVVLQWSANHTHNGGSSSYGDCLENHHSGRMTGCSLSYPMFKEIRAQTNVFSDVAAFAGPAQVEVVGIGGASMASVEFVSGDFFEALGVLPALGRVLERTDEAPEAEPNTVLGYAYWQRQFGGSADAVGRTIRVNNTPVRVVGVANPDFTRLAPGKTQDMWLPLTFAGTLRVDWAERMKEPSNWWLTVVGRLHRGMPAGKAQAGTTVLFRNAVLHGDKPLMKDSDDPKIALVPAQKGLTGIRSDLGQPLYILMAAVGTVLLVTCANVAGLMVARAAGREREMAVRSALGASRGRIGRQLLAESVLLSACGAALGLLLADWGARSLTLFLSSWRSDLVLDVAMNSSVLAFTALTGLLTGIVFGLAAALRSGRANAAALKENASSLSTIAYAGSPRFSLRSALVVVQVALSVVVLIAATLSVRTLTNLRGIHPGFETRNLLAFGVAPNLSGYGSEKIRNLYEEIQRRLAALPGVISASYASEILLNGGLWTTDVHIQGQPEQSQVNTSMLAVGACYFETMHIPLVAGRTFDVPLDFHSKQEVAIVNQSFVRRYLEGKNALGLHLQGGSDENRADREVVGVVADAKYDQLREDVRPTTYVPMKEGTAWFQLRTSSPPAALVPALRQQMREVDENLPIFGLHTQTETIDRLLFNERLVARFSSLFGLLALVLACVGLYGLLSYDVAQRTREIGIRRALGAQREDVLRLVVGQGMFLVVAGVMCGIGAALAVTRYLRSMLYGVPATDPTTFTTVAVLLLIVGLLACWIPARRAMRVEPMVALRYE